MILSPQLALSIGAVVAPALFLLSCYLTRAPTRRVLAALAASIAFAVANVIWDQVALQLHWWGYPSFTAANMVWLLYPPSGLVAGGAFGLIGWRVARRYGSKGLLFFLALWTLWGVIHDYGGAIMMKSSSLMVFGPGSLPVLANALLYASCQSIAQLMLRLIGGPYRSDHLARQLSSTPSM
jgi:hypothetical protein